MALAFESIQSSDDDDDFDMGDDGQAICLFEDIDDDNHGVGSVDKSESKMQSNGNHDM